MQQTLDNLSINRYPFVGSHDSATGIYTFKTNIPFVQTQSLDFYEQYIIGGIRFFDLRVNVNNKKKGIEFSHGIVELDTLREEKSFLKMIKKSIQDKELVIIDLNHYKDKEAVVDDFKKYLQTNNLYNNSFFITNIFDLSKTVSYYKSQNKYLIVVTGDLVIDNYDSSIGCFKDSYYFLKSCKKISCLDPNHYTWTDLFKYITERYNNYINNQPKDLTMIQTMFQAAPTASGKEAAFLCLFTDQSIKTEQKANVNRRLTEFFKKTGFKPNIIIVDNAGPESKKLSEQIKSNFKF